MTEEEIMTAYGDVPLLFKHYYKYSFNFEGVAPDGAIVGMSIGGDASGIYRLGVGRDQPETLKYGNWTAAAVDKNGKTLWSKFKD